MIVLDTNVVSELMRQAPDEQVVRWVDRYPADEVFITAVTAAELSYGVARLPEGQRKSTLAAMVSELLAEDLYGQILPFDGGAAQYYARIATAGKSWGGRSAWRTRRSRRSAGSTRPAWPRATPRTSRTPA